MIDTTRGLVIVLVLGLLGPARADEPKVILEAKGYLVPSIQVAVCPSVSGQITEMLVTEGQRVKKGEVLARLDDRVARLDLMAAQAKLEVVQAQLALLKSSATSPQIERAKAELTAAEANLHFHQAQLERLRKVLAQPEGNPLLKETIAEVRKAESLVQTCRAALDRATTEPRTEPRTEAHLVAAARVRQAQVSVERARLLLDQTTIRSPIDGTILSKRAEAGGYVNPQAISIPSTLVELADLRAMEVEVDIQERGLAGLQVGQPCLVRIDAFPENRYRGTVVRLGPLANRAKGAMTVRVRLEIPANDEKPRPEMGALVQFLTK